MWSVTRENLEKTHKINVNFTIDKHLYEQFKRVAQKDMRKYSNIVEGSIRRYVQSKVQLIANQSFQHYILNKPQIMIVQYNLECYSYEKKKKNEFNR